MKIPSFNTGRVTLSYAPGTNFRTKRNRMDPSLSMQAASLNPIFQAPALRFPCYGTGENNDVIAYCYPGEICQHTPSGFPYCIPAPIVSNGFHT